ncbi:MAG TPA: PQ-loop repeat-containing protein [Hyphomicrobiaceae bacterium]|nr:PQ-loop repeat-containing protein [Hyphomicrobiaceae bacterium]
MSLEEITLVLFAACNSVRVVAYIPQIFKAATDKNGASSISFMTWSLFLLAHLSTVVYTIINRSDWGLAACFAINAVAACHPGSRLLEAPQPRQTGPALCRPAGPRRDDAKLSIRARDRRGLAERASNVKTAYFGYCAGFSDACMTTLSAHADGRRPRGARALTQTRRPSW